jgi:hypothetical protein
LTLLFLQEMPKALAAVGAIAPENFPARIREKIFEGIEQQAKVLAAG